MEMKDDESQTLRLRVDQISSELHKQDRVRAVNTKWMLTVGAVIIAALGYTNFVQLPREAAKAAREQVGPDVVEEANRIVDDLKQDKVYAQGIKDELGKISDMKKIANLPIGTIAPSMLDPSKFAEAVGDPNRTTWVLADGNDVTDSQYGKLLLSKNTSSTSNTISTPDLRGMFLRGMNVNGGQDPEQNRIAGSRQPDALQQHGHQTNAKAFIWSDPSTDYGYTSVGGAHAPPASVTDVRGASTAVETRPKNVAVYFYIKIN